MTRYVATTWVDKVTRLGPTNLNHIEQGIASISTLAFNVKDYGAVGNATTDDTTSIQSTIDACAAAGGGTVYLPPGTYKITAALVITATSVGGTVSVSIVGASAGSTTIMVVGDINAIRSTGYPNTELTGCKFSDFTIRYQTQAAAGIAINLPWADRVYVERVIVDGCFNALGIGQIGAISTINEIGFRDVNIRNVAGSALNFQGLGGNVYVTDSVFTGTGNSGTSKCLSWNNSYYDVIWLRGLDFENFGFGLDFSAASSGTTNAGLVDAYLEDIIIDAPYSYAVNYSTTNAYASFWRIKHRNLWAIAQTTAPIALHISGGANSTIQDMTFSGCNFQAFTGTGVLIEGNGTAGAVVQDITFDDCQIYMSTTGFQVTGCKRAILRNSTIGAPYGGGTTGILLQGGANSQNCLVDGNTVTGYATPVSVAAAGAGTVVRNNQGANPLGPQTAPGVPATTVVFTHTFVADCQVYVTAGASTCTVAVGGTTMLILAAADTGAFAVPAGATITLTYANAPTWAWYAL